MYTGPGAERAPAHKSSGASFPSRLESRQAFPWKSWPNTCPSLLLSTLWIWSKLPAEHMEITLTQTKGFLPGSRTVWTVVFLFSCSVPILVKLAFFWSYTVIATRKTKTRKQQYQNTKMGEEFSKLRTKFEKKLWQISFEMCNAEI